MKNLLIVFILLFSVQVAYAGAPVIQSITSLNSPIVVGQEVYFNSTITTEATATCIFGLLVDFGPFAVGGMSPYNTTFAFNGFNSLSNVIGPIVFNTPGMINISQVDDYNGVSTCSLTPEEFILAIEVLPAPSIPTLSQWGLIVVGFFLMIFGVVTLKRRSTGQVKLS